MNLQPEFFHLNFLNLYMFKSAVKKYYESNVFFCKQKNLNRKNLNGATSCDVNDKDKQK